MTMRPPPNDYAVIQEAWVEELAQEADQQAGLTPANVSRAPAAAVHGIACEGPSLTPCLLVTHPSHVQPAQQFASQYTDSHLPVRIVDAAVAPPFTPTNGWGTRNHYTGRLTGGKAALRWEGTRRSGSTISFVALTRTGDPVVVGNNHSYVPPGGRDSPEGAFKLLQLGDHQPLGQTWRWKQITTDWERWPNMVDAAIAQVPESWDGELEHYRIEEIGDIVGTGSAMPGDKVVKNGATTGVTHGEVTRVHVTSRIGYRWPGTEEHEFILSGLTEVANRDLAGPGPFAAAGDSGSAVVEEGEQGVWLLGLHFAGSSRRALYCPIEPVIEELELRTPSHARRGR